MWAKHQIGVEGKESHDEMPDPIVWENNKSLPSLLRRPDHIDRTMLAEWFSCNRTDSEARSLYYSEFPSRYVWDPDQKVCKSRTKGRDISRIAHVHPAAGELCFF